MEFTEAQYQRIAHLLPVQRGNVRIANIQVLNAMLYIANRAASGVVCPAFWQMAHDLHADEPLGQERRAGPRLCTPAAKRDRAGQTGGGLFGQHGGQGAS